MKPLYEEMQKMFRARNTESAYSYGIWTADGYVRKKGNSYEASIGQKYGYFVEPFAEKFKLRVRIRAVELRGKTFSRLEVSFSSSPAKVIYENLGERKERVFESFKDEIDPLWVSAFLSGYLDGDGSVNHQGHVVFLVAESSTEALIERYLELLEIRYWKSDIGNITVLGVSRVSELRKLKSLLYNTPYSYAYKKQRLQGHRELKIQSLKSEEKKAALALLRGGNTVKEVAERCGCATNTVQRWKRELGLGAPRKAEVIGEVRGDIDRGTHKGDIAKKFRISINTLNRWLRDED